MKKIWLLPLALALVTLTGFTCSKNKDQAETSANEAQPIVEVQQEPITAESTATDANPATNPANTNENSEAPASSSN